MKVEKCIMPESSMYSTVRYAGLERHEIFFGRDYRQKSIDDGLVVFLTPEKHRGYNGVHGSGEKGIKFNKDLKRLGQKVAMEHYGWTIQQFIDRYGKSYL